MEAGKLNKLITIQQATETKNTFGEVEQSWDNPTTVATLWAEKVPQNSRVFFAAKQSFAEIAALFRIRYTSGIERGMRAVGDSEPFEIIVPPIDPDGKRKELHLLCREVV